MYPLWLRVKLAGLGLLLAGQMAAAADSGKVPRIAILPGSGERARAEVALAQVEGALLADPSLVLLERQQVNKVKKST